jgi:two-component system, NtrC family, response regulator HupR/HoxA
MDKKKSILILDDQPEILNTLERLLKEEYKIFTTTHGEQALKILAKEEIALILADQRMPTITGVEFFSKSMEIQPSSVRILITAYADINASIDAINKGHIFHYISKPWEPDELLIIVRRAIEKYELEQKNKQLTQELKEANIKLKTENFLLQQNLEQEYDFSKIIGHSPKMMQVFKLLSKVIDTPTTVLLLGETGTGKEMIARAIHYNSKRKDHLFVAQNCGALPDSLLESELFGHVKGSFTGAISDHKGIFEVADGGSVFLDEIADTSAALQLRLLRVLQEGEIKPVGGSKTVSVNVRIIAATNKNLEDEVKKGSFREDLYYRLNVFPIILPPLRERREDITDLVDHFIAKYSKKIGKNINSISQEALALLLRSPFSGNIRELENEIERAITLADDNTSLTPELISPRFHNLEPSTPNESDDTLSLKDAVSQLEKKLITSALLETNGNILKAAENLQLSRPGLHKMIKRLGLNPKNV